jgi:hypothetical protein
MVDLTLLSVCFSENLHYRFSCYRPLAENPAPFESRFAHSTTSKDSRFENGAGSTTRRLQRWRAKLRAALVISLLRHGTAAAEGARRQS